MYVLQFPLWVMLLLAAQSIDIEVLCSTVVILASLSQTLVKLSSIYLVKVTDNGLIIPPLAKVSNHQTLQFHSKPSGQLNRQHFFSFAAIVCDSQPYVHHATWNLVSPLYGEQAQYVCQRGYVFLNKKRVLNTTCSISSKWEPMIPDCHCKS